MLHTGIPVLMIKMINRIKNKMQFLKNPINNIWKKKMNLKLQEKDASALFLVLDEIVNFDLKKY